MFKHILVPLDGSPLAEAAIPAALELAGKFGSEITLLRVTYPPYIATSITWGSAYAELITEMRSQAFAEAEEYLRAHQGSLRQQGHKVHAHIVEGEPVADLILDMLDSLGIDAIVMSTHGRGGLGRWVFGSVADKVLRKAHVPILLIRAEEKAAD
ncbi:MAG: universal stress protein [Chloroflexota bacterium]